MEISQELQGKMDDIIEALFEEDEEKVKKLLDLLPLNEQQIANEILATLLDTQ